MTVYRVATGVTTPSYDDVPPYHPDTAYPELPFEFEPSKANPPYALLRRLFRDLGLDAANFGSSAWNPLGSILRPGQSVVIKPNFVLSRNSSGGGLAAVVTHPSVLRALVDYAFIAVGREGRITIADAPQMDCTWSELMAFQRLDAVQDFYQTRLGFKVDVLDLRDFEMADPTQPAYSTNRRKLRGDPAGHAVVNLGRSSEFFGLDTDRFYGADFDRTATISCHTGERHEYHISRTVLAADAIISVPKMKVHKKVGVTLNLKGLVGINTDKNCLVHYRLGMPSEGGDQLPDRRSRSDLALVRAQRWFSDRAMARQDAVGDTIYRAARGVYRNLIGRFRRVSPQTRIMDAGNWHGNDSAWRMTRDLMRIIYYADAAGRMHDVPQRKIFSVVDGIIGGENNGPLSPDPKPCGCLVIGSNPLAVDVVTARLMGINPRRLKQFALGSGKNAGFGPDGDEEIEVSFDGEKAPHRLDGLGPARCFAFRPHPGWVGQVEADHPRQSAVTP